MAKSIYDRLKESLQATFENKNNIVDSIAVTSKASNPSVQNLINLFNNMMKDKDVMLKSFNKLMEERAAIYETTIDLFYANYHYYNIETTLNSLLAYFKLMEIFKSSEFSSYSDRFMALVDFGLPIEGANLNDINYIQNFYKNKFENISQLFSFIGDFTFEEDLKLDGIIIESESYTDHPEYYLLYILGYLGNLDINNYSNDFRSLLASIRSSNGRFTDGLFDRLNIYLKNIKDNIETFLLVENNRKENNANYSENYISTIIEKYKTYLANLLNNVSITNNNIEEIKASGMFDLIFFSIKEIKNEIEKVGKDAINSLKIVNQFIENHALFIEFPENITNKFKVSLLGLSKLKPENSASAITSFSIPTDFVFISLPDSTDFSSFKEKFFVLSDKLISFYEPYLIWLLYFGYYGGKYNLNCAQEYMNYALINLYDKSLIEETVSSTFISNRDMEETLLTLYNLKIKENIDSETILSGIKVIFPELSVIDLLSFSDILSDITISRSSFEELTTGTIFEFNQALRFFVLKAFLKNKKDLNKKLDLLIDVFNNGRNLLGDLTKIGKLRENSLKTIYLETIIRILLTDILEFLENNETLIISARTKAKIDDYLNGIIVGERTIDEYNAELANSYLTTWNYLYSTEVNLLEEMFDSGSAFRTILI